jgi:uncharacterized protein (DUF58 family)
MSQASALPDNGALSGLRRRWRSWFYGYRAPERGRIVLGHRRVYILPARLGLMFGATLLIMLIGSINYVLSLGFMLTFVLAGMGVAGMVHTVRNLARLAIVPGRVEPVFAGEAAQFRLHLENAAPWERPAVLLRHAPSEAQMVADVPAAGGIEVVLAIPAERRGWLPIGRLTLETRYPIGLFRAWSYIEPEMRALVYPRPELTPLPAASPDASAGALQASARGTEDYSGLRDYSPADSPRHVAWKAVARGENMLTKQFSGHAAARLWLDWALLPAGIDDETRLSRLAGWVLEAERRGLRYGLRLPGKEIEPGQGEAHRSACLSALALHAADAPQGAAT